MLGEKVSMLEGKVTGRRVVANPGGTPKVEASFQGSGQLVGIETMDLGSYQSSMRPDGSLYGEGQGVVMGKGGEMASWSGTGLGSLRQDGSVSYRGAIYYQTNSPAWTRLNSVAVVFEFDVDSQGNVKSGMWEWK